MSKQKYSKVAADEDGDGAAGSSLRWVAASVTPRSAATGAVREPGEAAGPEGRELGSGTLATEMAFIWRVAWPTAISTMFRAGTQQVWATTPAPPCEDHASTAMGRSR
jgi:hypothetical protein